MTDHDLEEQLRRALAAKADGLTLRVTSRETMARMRARRRPWSAPRMLAGLAAAAAIVVLVGGALFVALPRPPAPVGSGTADTPAPTATIGPTPLPSATPTATTGPTGARAPTTGPTGTRAPPTSPTSATDCDRNLASPPPTPTVVPGPTAIGLPSLHDGPLEPGRYFLPDGGHTLAVFDRCWRAAVGDSAITLSRIGDSSTRLTLFNVRADYVVMCALVRPVPGSAAPDRHALAAWVRGLSHLRSSEPTETKIGGKPVIQLDVTAERAADACPYNPGSAASLPVIGGAMPGDRARVLILDSDDAAAWAVGSGGLVLVVISAPGNVFDEYLPIAMRVAQSLTIYGPVP